MTTLDEVVSYIEKIRKQVSWDSVGILLDEGPSNQVVVLSCSDQAVAAFILILCPKESVEALRVCAQEGDIELRSWQGHTLSVEHLKALDKLDEVWRKARDQSSRVDSGEILEFLERIETESKKKGRIAHLTKKTRNEILFASHGRCMFEGCGVDLMVDPITGESGNFTTLAHNVAASEEGPRGVPWLSEQLSDDPTNILVLCDTHHRLVDRVARADYSAERLSRMKRQFHADAKVLLDGLKLIPVPAYFIDWRVHEQETVVPSSLDISGSLKTIGARLENQIQTVSRGDSLGLESFHRILAQIVRRAADRILMQSYGSGSRGGLFAMGSMPALIALGALLGNKCGITPMLLYRRENRWYWPSSTSRGEFYGIEGLGEINGETDVCLVLGMTKEPPALTETATSLTMPVVRVVAHDDVIGNGALGHPDDGILFRHRMYELLLHLKEQHGVARIHVLPCASNAVCTFFGQAFDNYHPELLIYDFSSNNERMVPVLRVTNVCGVCAIHNA